MTLLPPTAFTDWRERLGEDHPCLEGLDWDVPEEVEEVKVEVGEEARENENANAMVVDEDEPQSHSLSIPNPKHDPSTKPDTHPAPNPHLSRDIAPSFFTDLHFLASLRTFQDHLFLNYFSDAHTQKVKAYKEGIANGTLAAPWKDQVWERDNPVSVPARDTGAEPSSSLPLPSGSGPGAAFTTLAG